MGFTDGPRTNLPRGQLQDQRDHDEQGRATPHNTRAVDRAIAILKAFRLEEPELGVTELSRRLSLHKSTVYRLLVTLEKHGLVDWVPESGKYRLGMTLFELGSLVATVTDLRRVARPVLEALHNECGETLHLAILDMGDVVYIEKLESRARLRMYSEVGRRAPAHCTGLGKVLLAYLPDSELEKILQQKGLTAFTARTIVSPALLREHLAEVRRNGYAVDAGEHEELVRCAAAPVRDHSGRVVAAVSIAAIGLDTGTELFKEFIRKVVAAAAEISRRLGFRDDEA